MASLVFLWLHVNDVGIQLSLLGLIYGIVNACTVGKELCEISLV